MKIIAHIKTDMPEKFGIPRQSGIVPELKGVIEFEKEYSDPEAVEGLEGFEYIWVLWLFDGFSDSFAPKVRPPRLGGNKRVGVFATRSPNRPNPIGLSCVKLEKVETGEKTRLYVSGVDMRDNTKIIDIKPYIPFADSKENARAGFVNEKEKRTLSVTDPDGILDGIEEKDVIIKLIGEDPRPAYHGEDGRIYTMRFARYDISFVASMDKAVISDIEIIEKM